MATIANKPDAAENRGNARFFTIMAFVMSAIIIAGFSVNLAFARSSFNVPAIYHVHAVIAWRGWVCTACSTSPRLPAIGPCTDS